MLPIDDLKALFPSAKPGVIEAIDDHLENGELTTVRRQAMFIAQTSHETMGFRCLKEMGSSRYLMRYEGRKDLGNIHRGDGAKYCGRGLIMVTGRANYAAASLALDLPLLDEPSLLEQPNYAVQAAVWFWTTRTRNKKTCNDYADANDFPGMTRLINGGMNGYADRLAWLTKIYNVLV